MKRVLGLLIALLLLVTISYADTLIVRCLENDWHPISGASVNLSFIGKKGGDKTGITNDKGEYSFLNVNSSDRSGVEYRVRKNNPSPARTSKQFKIYATSMPRVITFVNPDQVYYSDMEAKQAYLEWLNQQAENAAKEIEKQKKAASRVTKPISR